MSPFRVLRSVVGCFLLFLSAILVTTAQVKKPNILVIFGDHIGQANISPYTHGGVGYTAPDIDRIGDDGFTFTDY
jgi:hypothetical protein